MRPRLYTVRRAGAGRLSMMARPPGGDWLTEDLRGLRRLGVEMLVSALTAGRHVVIHCRAGIGRASLVAGALLVAEGLEPERAWQRLAAARGLPVPDTDQQRQWLQRFARR